MFADILVCFLAGMGAGLGTGFAGMSAVTFIGPMLLTFLGIPAYQAIGVGLASDVLASAASAWTYWKNDHLDIKHGSVMLVFVLVFTAAGSYAARFLPNTTLGTFSLLGTFLMGLRFLLFPLTSGRTSMPRIGRIPPAVVAAICGSVIGFICGFIGAGGGMMMLMILTTVLFYELKTAVGTSVFIMTFTALTGAVSHFVIGGLPAPHLIITCALSTLFWAVAGARIANRSDPLVLNHLIGFILTGLAIAMLIINFLRGV